MKRKHAPLISIEASFIWIGILTLLIVAIPISEWVMSSLMMVVTLLIYAIYRSRTVLR